MTGFAGKRNIYTCQACSRFIVTVDQVDGVTPFMMRCKATPGCTGDAQSSMYRVFDQGMRPTHEWYRPTPDELEPMAAWTKEHVGMGGLVIREIAGEPSAFWALELAARVDDYGAALVALWDAGAEPTPDHRTLTGLTLDESFDRIWEVVQALRPGLPAQGAAVDQKVATAAETRPLGKRAERRRAARAQKGKRP